MMAGGRGAKVVVALVVALGAAVGSVSGVAAQQPSTVDVEVEAGDGGVVVGGAAIPVRVTLSSERARTVDVVVEWNQGYREYRSELPANAPVQLDLSLPMAAGGPGQIRVGVDDEAERLGGDQVDVEIAGDSTLVGIGSSLASAGAPESAPTVAGVQEARLVELVDDSWVRPGWLESMSTVVLGAQDVDRLDEDAVTQLRTWVWRGGELIVDVARTDPLPVVELPAEPGQRTPVGAGWVRFSDGLAATGAWSTVLEPAMQRTELVPSGEQWFGGDGSSLVGLVDIEFLSVWVIVAAVFGSALLAGPVLWLLLRTRHRRRWMWLAAPGVSLLVAALLLVVGQGVFTRSEVSAASSIVVDPWQGSGSVSMGLKRSEVLELPAGAELVASSPSALVTDTGERSTASIEIGRNAFGMLGVSPVDLDDGPKVSLSAVVNAEGTVDVTVTNDADADLVGVVVQGSGRARSFSDVPAGESVTLPFEVLSEVPPLGLVFDASAMPIDVVDPNGVLMPAGGIGFGGGPFGPVRSADDLSLPLSRGIVVVTGSLSGDITALGRTLPGRSEITAIAPVTSGAPAPSALRIDAVGPPPPFLLDEEEFIQDDGSVVVEEPAWPDLVEQYVRFSAAAGRPAGTCGLHTFASELEFWDGAAWVPAKKVGDPLISPRLYDQEVQRWEVPEIAPGGSLLASFSVGPGLQSPLLFDCVED